MSVRFLMSLAVVLALAAGSAIAQNPTGRKPDPTVELLAKLRKPVDWAKADGVTVNDLINQIEKNFSVNVLVNQAAFKDSDPPINTQKMNVPLTRGMSLISTLPYLLGQLDATYLVHKDHLEIVPIAYAAQETKNAVPSEDDGPVRMAQPLVSMIFKERPLNEALAELAEEYNLTVIVSPQSGDARTGFVSARLLNTPADQAIELLALQSDLRVVRKANTFIVTSRDHSNDLFNERMERERTKIDLDKLRNAPPTPPQQQPAPLQLQLIPVAPVMVPVPKQP